MRPVFVLSLVVAAALPPLPASAQKKALPPVDSNSVIVIGRTKGRDVSGRVVATDDTSLTIVTLKSKQVVLPRRSVESWHVRRGTLTAKGFRDTDLNTHRLFFGPTARTLERRVSYLETYFMFVWAGAYGVSDRVMVSGGTAIMEGWDSASAKATGANGPAWLDGRVGIIRSPKAAVALGALWGAWSGPRGGSIGNVYAVVTLGSNDHAVTVMGGYPFARNNVANEPTFMAGGVRFQAGAPYEPRRDERRRRYRGRRRQGGHRSPRVGRRRDTALYASGVATGGRRRPATEAQGMRATGCRGGGSRQRLRPGDH